MSDIKIPKGQELLLSIKNLHETRKLRPSDPRLKVPTAKRRVGRRRAQGRGWRFLDPFWIRNPATRKYYTPPELIYRYVDDPLPRSFPLPELVTPPRFTQDLETIRNYVFTNREYILNNAFEITPDFLRPHRFFRTYAFIGQAPLNTVATYTAEDGWVFDERILTAPTDNPARIYFYALLGDYPSLSYTFHLLQADIERDDRDSPLHWSRGGNYICAGNPSLWKAYGGYGTPDATFIVEYVVRPTVLPFPPRDAVYDPNSIYWDMSPEQFLGAIDGLYAFKRESRFVGGGSGHYEYSYFNEPIGARHWSYIMLENFAGAKPLNARMVFRDGELVYSSITPY